MEEVTRQLGPTTRMLESLNRWKLSLWSNGSGGPPGYLETAREEDKERYTRLFETMNELKAHKEGVDKFITIFEDREAQRNKRRKFWMGILWKAGGPIGAGLLGLLAIGWRKAAPVIDILWKDYLRAHPMVLEKMEHLTHDNPEQMYDAREEKLDAGTSIY